MKNKFSLLVALSGFIILFCNFQTKNSPPVNADLHVAFYNTENFFDTIDDPKIQDEEFLPTAKSQWTSTRYQTKVVHISNTIAAMNNGNAPDIIGLSEIENQTPLNDLCNSSALKKYNYGIVHFDSPDPRGIDVALLYKKSILMVVSSEVIPVTIDSLPDFKTRDILMVQMQEGKQKFFVFVNHWPSRRGGTEKSEPKRFAAAQTLKNKVDEILKQQLTAHIIIMGDLNDDPQNKSIVNVLGAKLNISAGYSTPYLFDYGTTIPDSSGSIFYKGLWDLFDQIIVTNNFAEACNPDNTTCGFHVFKTDFLLEKNQYNEMEPFRTYAGTNYLGGYSDHLPVEATLVWK